MKSKMRNEKSKGITLKAAIGTFALMLLSLVLVYVSSFMLPRGMGAREEAWFDLRIYASFFNLALIAYLFFTYLKDYLLIKTKFTLGILAFLMVFSFYAIISNPLLMFAFGFRGGGGPFSFASLVFSGLALLILVWISEQ